MKEALVDKLRCATCGHEELRSHGIERDAAGDIIIGVVYCPRGHWFPIEDGILEFLPPPLSYSADRDRFARQHADDLIPYGIALQSFDNPDRTKPGAAGAVEQAVLLQQSHFDWYAENGDQSYDEYSLMPFWRAVDGYTFERWRQRIASGAVVLDIGRAQGRASLQLAEAAPTVIGIDISKKLVQKARTNFKQACFPGESEFFAADGSRPPFRSGIFDCVLIYGVLHHLPNPEMTCREAARILKDQGLLLSSENNRSAFRAIFDLLMKVRLLWHEEAGALPLLSREHVSKWFEGTGVRVDLSTIVYLPPHLINLLPRVIGKAALRLTDAICGALPFFRWNGGLLLIEGQKISQSAGGN